VRAYDSRLARGAKFFAFGWGNAALPPDLYTDGSTSYVEMHGGIAPTFADTARLSRAGAPPGRRAGARWPGWAG
jgi:hypothetical protein